MLSTAIKAATPVAGGTGSNTVLSAKDDDFQSRWQRF
jgi:hypothetical protein